MYSGSASFPRIRKNLIWPHLKKSSKDGICRLYSLVSGAKVVTKSVTLKVKGHQIMSVSPKGVYSDNRTCHGKYVFSNKHVAIWFISYFLYFEGVLINFQCIQFDYLSIIESFLDLLDSVCY